MPLEYLPGGSARTFAAGFSCRRKGCPYQPLGLAGAALTLLSAFWNMSRFPPLLDKAEAWIGPLFSPAGASSSVAACRVPFRPSQSLTAS
jgi:hypothetical protein